MSVVRISKFRHLYGVPARKDLCYEGFKAIKTAHDASVCAVNPWFIAVVMDSAGGGTFLVVPLKKRGRVGVGHPKVSGHSGPVTDLKWNPFDPTVIASSSEDSLVRLWQIPPTGLLMDLTEPVCELEGHTKRVTQIEWHPTASNILLSTSTDQQCILWNTEEASIVNTISVHHDTILSISWNRTGSLFASICKDRRIRVIDPRKGTVVAEGEGHEGLKAARIIFLGDTNQLFTTGFSRGSQRQIALWNANDLSRPLRKEDIDSSSGLLIPFFDPDTGIVFVAGKGDGNIRYYEILTQPPDLVYLSQFQSSNPQCGIGMMPKYGMDPYKCEITRFYKLHTTKDICEPISMIAPRKSDSFQADLFPPTAAPEPVLTAREWLQGQDAEPRLIPMKDIGNTLAEMFPTLREDGYDFADSHAKKSKASILKNAQKINSSTEPAKQWPNEEINNAKENNVDDDAEWKGTVRSNIGRFELQTSTPLQQLHRGFSTTTENTTTNTVSDTPTIRKSSHPLKGNTFDNVTDNATRVPAYQTNLLRRTATISTPDSPRPGHDKQSQQQVNKVREGTEPPKYGPGTDVNGEAPWQDRDDNIFDEISRDAPDNTLITPSVLRLSMRSRTKSQDDSPNSLMYRRATSLREPRNASGSDKRSHRDWLRSRALSQDSKTRRSLQIFTETDSKQTTSEESGQPRQQFSNEESRQEAQTAGTASSVQRQDSYHRLSLQDYAKFRSSRSSEWTHNSDRYSWPSSSRTKENESTNSVDHEATTTKMNWHTTDGHQQKQYGERKEEDENKNWKENLNHIGSPVVHVDLRRTESIRQEQLDIPADYSKLLSKYLGQTEEIRELKDSIFIKDKTIDRLEKQLRLLQEGIVLPPSNP